MTSSLLQFGAGMSADVLALIVGGLLIIGANFWWLWASTNPRR